MLHKTVEEHAFSTLHKLVSHPGQSLILRTQDIITMVHTHEIIRCEGESGYTTFYFLNKESMLVSKGLSYFEDKLIPFGFFRTHQSHIINLRMFDTYYRKDETILLRNDDLVPLATRRKESFMLILRN